MKTSILAAASGLALCAFLTASPVFAQSARVDAEGKPRFQGFEGFVAGGPGGGRRAGAGPDMGGFEFNFGGGGGRGGFDPSDIFADLFRAQRGGQRVRRELDVVREVFKRAGMKQQS